MYEELKKQIEECDMLLIGIGSEASFSTGAEYNRGSKKEYWMDYVAGIQDSERQHILDFYNDLYELIDKKNYFIITTNADGIIFDSKINPIRIVAPCGNILRMQCSCNGADAIKDIPEDFYESADKPVCPVCKCLYVPNVYGIDNYNEEGYLKQWRLYNKWLQGTLNKRLLILEIGCDFSLLSIIRLPFEKIALINQKSVYYRINKKFPQVTAELGKRMHSAADTPWDFISNLKNQNCSI